MNKSLFFIYSYFKLLLNKKSDHLTMCGISFSNRIYIFIYKLKVSEVFNLLVGLKLF